MIKNVIFDLDGVLRITKDEPIKDFLPNELLLKMKVEDLGLTLKQFYKKYITGTDFIYSFDIGDLNEEQLTTLACEKFKIDKELFSYLLGLRLKDEFNVYFTECFDLIHELKKNGYNIFLLSNMNVEMAKVLKNHLKDEPFNDLLFSCDIKLLKPNPEIYEYALKKWSASSEESIFIDDNAINIESFKSLGGKTFLFDRFNIENSVKKLRKAIYGDSGHLKRNTTAISENNTLEK